MEKRRDVKKAPSRIVDTAKEYRAQHKKESMGRAFAVVDDPHLLVHRSDGIARPMLSFLCCARYSFAVSTIRLGAFFNITSLFHCNSSLSFWKLYALIIA